MNLTIENTSSYGDTLSYGDIIELALKVKISDLPKFCSLSSKYNVCKDNYFWRRRTEQDFDYPISSFLKLTDENGDYRYSGVYIYKVLYKTTLEQAIKNNDIKAATVLYFNKFNKYNVDMFFIIMVEMGDSVLIKEIMNNPNFSPTAVKMMFVGIVPELNDDTNNIFINPIIHNYIDTVKVLLTIDTFDPTYHMKTYELFERILETNNITVDMLDLLLTNEKFKKYFNENIGMVFQYTKNTEIIKYMLDHYSFREDYIKKIILNSVSNRNDVVFNYFLTEGLINKNNLLRILREAINWDNGYVVKRIYEVYQVSEKLTQELFKETLIKQAKRVHLTLMMLDIEYKYDRIMQLAEYIIMEDYKSFSSHLKDNMKDLTKEEISDLNNIILNLDYTYINYITDLKKLLNVIRYGPDNRITLRFSAPRVNSNLS